MSMYSKYSKHCDNVLVMSSTWMLVLVSCPPLQATFPTQLTLSAPSERGVYTDSKIESGWSVTSGGASLGNEKWTEVRTPTFRGNISLLTFAPISTRSSYVNVYLNPMFHFTAEGFPGNERKARK